MKCYRKFLALLLIMLKERLGWLVSFFPPLCGVSMDRAEQVGLRALPKGPTIVAPAMPNPPLSEQQPSTLTVKPLSLKNHLGSG